ncbi:hypothetical protein D049_0658B, partial [Vibrio parahaemolyticus VPTS-2010]
HGLHLLGIYDP